MALRRIKIGDVIVPFKRKCGNSHLTPYEVSGINQEKEFFEPSRQVGEDTSDYQDVPPGHFACNLMHIGRDAVLPIAYNHTNKTKHVSPAYSIFRLKENSGLLDYYFFMFLKSNERDRLFWFHADSSVRDGMTWEDFCNIEIDIPNLAIQQKYVEVYLSVFKNLESYETGLLELRIASFSCLEKAKKNYVNNPLGNYCFLSDEINEDEKFKNVKGLTVYKTFIDTKADMSGVSLKNYKVVNKGDIGFVPTTNRNGDRIACGFAHEQCIVSSTYEVLRVRDRNLLLPEYLFLWFMREEMDRFARYNSWGSARETITWEDLSSFKIPVPPITIQKAIVDIYQCYARRKEINDRLKTLSALLCPILIAGSIKESKGV